MGKSLCPFCNSQNTLNIAYGYLGDKKEKLNYIDQEEIGEKIKYKKGYEKIDFDGEKLISRNPNRYCKDCKKTFQSRKVLYTVDITTIDLVICTNDYYRYTFDFSNNNKHCTVKKNRIIIEEKNLTEEEKNKILKSIKTNKPNLWHGHYGLPYDHTKYYWILKCTYYNGVDYCKSGNDTIPDNWLEFIIPFKEIFKQKIFELN
ncbi:MAG: hypothetical protein NC310_08810 [Roseburia sp.]|nr:hypothetical protein [Roseburia sp.]